MFGSLEGLVIVLIVFGGLFFIGTIYHFIDKFIKYRREQKEYTEPFLL